jgi:hypothetical protein
MVEKKTRNYDLFFGILLSVFSLYVLIESLRMPIEKVGGYYTAFYSAPGFLPFLTSGVLLVMGLHLILHSLRKGANLKWISWPNFLWLIKERRTQRVLLILALCSFYTFIGIGRAPYWLVTFIFLVTFMFLFKATQWWKIFTIAAGCVAVLYLLFAGVFEIPLP